MNLKEIKNKENLNVEELKYLYEIDNSIDINSYEEEMLLQEIKNNRNIKKDISLIYGCEENEVGIEDHISKISNNIVVYYGNLNVNNIEDKKYLSTLKIVIGNINCDEYVCRCFSRD